MIKNKIKTLNLRAYVCRGEDAHLGAVFRSGEDAHLCRCVHASARRRKRAQGRRFDAEIPRFYGAPT